MSERNPRDHDEALSALVDGELEQSEEATLRQAIEADSDTRDRFAAFEAVDQALRDLEAPPLQADLRERLEARIAQEAAPRRSAFTPLALAAAIGAILLAGWFALAPNPVGREETTVTRQGPDDTPPQESVPSLAPEPEPAVEIAEAPTAPAPERGVIEQPEAQPDAQPNAQPEDPFAPSVQLANDAAPETPAPEDPAAEIDASDLELAIAFELETLRDLEVIEELDLLEALLLLEEREKQGGNRRTS